MEGIWDLLIKWSSKKYWMINLWKILRISSVFKEEGLSDKINLIDTVVEGVAIWGTNFTGPRSSS